MFNISKDYMEEISHSYFLFVSIIILYATTFQLLSGNRNAFFISLSVVYMLFHVIYGVYRYKRQRPKILDRNLLRILRVIINLIFCAILLRLSSGAPEYYLIFIWLVFIANYRFYDAKKNKQIILLLTILISLTYWGVQLFSSPSKGIPQFSSASLRTFTLAFVSYISFVFFMNRLREKKFYNLSEDLGIKLNFTDRLSVVLEKIADMAIETLNADIITFYIYDQKEKVLVQPPFFFGDILYPEDMLSQIGDEDVGYLIIKEGKNIYATDTKKHRIMSRRGHTPRIPKGHFVFRENIVSSAAIILTVRNEIIGIMFVNYRKSREFLRYERLIIEKFAAYASIALKNARELEETIGEITALASNIYNIQRQREIPEILKYEREIYKLVLDVILILLKESLGYYASYNPYKKSIEVEVASEIYEKDGLVGNTWSSSKGITGKAVRTGKIQLCNNLQKSVEYLRFCDKHEGLPHLNVDKDVRSCLTFPIKLHGVVLGIYHIESKRLNNFSERDVQIITSMADQARLAVQNLKLVQELYTISKISQKLVDYRLDLSSRLNSILYEGRKLIGDCHGNIAQYDKKKNELLVIASTVLETVGKKLDIDSSICGKVIKTGEIKYVKDVNEEKDYKMLFGEKINSELAVPIVHGEDMIGVLNFESPHIDGFTDLDQYEIKKLADQVSLGVQFLVLSEQNKRKGKVLGVVEELDRAILESRFNLAKTFYIVLQEGLSLIDEAYGEIIIYNKPKDELRVEASTFPGETKRIIPKENSVCGRSLKEKKTVYIPDISKIDYYNKPYAENDCLTTLSELVVPLMVSGEIVGFFNVESEKKDGFSLEDRELLEIFSNQIAIAIVTASTYEDLQNTKDRLIETDSRVLDGMSNFLSGRFHDIANPVAAIRTDVETVIDEEEGLSKNSQKIFERIISKCGKIFEKADNSGKLLEEFLLAKKKKLRLLDIVDEALNEFDKPDNVSIAKDIPDNLPCIRGHSIRLKDLIKEFLTNSSEAMPLGGAIKISASSTDTLVTLSIEDNGIGMNDSLINRIFDYGFTAKKGHSGWGLFNNYLTIKAHKGTVKVNSKSSEGTKFEISFPAIK